MIAENGRAGGHSCIPVRQAGRLRRRIEKHDGLELRAF